MNIRMRSAGTAIAAFALLQLAAAICVAQPLRPAASADGLPEASRAWKQQLVDNASAPVKVVEFFDYQCPFCAATIPALEEALRGYPGKVQLVLKNMPLSFHHDSMLAHQAALAAGEQGRFWEMYALLYANQKKLKPEDLLDYARSLNLDMALFLERLETGYYKPAIEKDLAAAAELRVTGTPTFFINDERLEGRQSADRLRHAIDSALANPNRAISLPQSRQHLGLAKDVDLFHSPSRGSKEAPVTIIEFSDMQCPFCAKAAPTLVELMAQYPGQIRWVFKSFPLPFHSDSELAHRAALAAERQGKFWEMHDLIFSDQRNIKRGDLLRKAQSLDLDMARFTADLESEELKRRVASDLNDGLRSNVTATPTFFVNGKEYSGALSLNQFRAIVTKDLPAGAAARFADVPGEKQNEISIGASNSPITLTWFSDLGSSLTMQATLQLRELLKTHPGKIRLVFKNCPLETHPGAIRLHEAALAANAQGKFWEMHDLIIRNPEKTDKATLLSYASRLGLDLARFEKELDGDQYRRIIDQDLKEARSRDVNGTPVFFLNATRIDGLRSQQVLNAFVESELAHGFVASSGKP
jgi:protein-disulfide isomerase